MIAVVTLHGSVAVVVRAVVCALDKPVVDCMPVVVASLQLFHGYPHISFSPKLGADSDGDSSELAFQGSGVAVYWEGCIEH